MVEQKYEITVEAGVGSEKGPNEPFRYISSEIPEGVKSVDEEPYRTLTNEALSFAREAVLATGKNLTLKFGINLEK